MPTGNGQYHALLFTRYDTENINLTNRENEDQETQHRQKSQNRIPNKEKREEK